MDFYLLIAFGLPALAAAVGLIAVRRRPGSRGFWLAGWLLVFAAVAEPFLIELWVSEGCYETWQPCDGRVLDLAPWLLFLGLAAGSLAMSIALLLTWGWYGPRGTREKPNLR